AVTMPLALAGIAIRRPPARRLAMVLGLIVLVNGLGGWPVAQRVLMPRVDRAITEVTAAVEADVYTTDAGLRVGLWRAAATIIRAHPIRGVGAGGFPAAYRETSIYRDAVGADPQSQAFMERDHPHSTPLNLLASYGLIGGGLAAAFVVLLLVRTVRMRNDHAYADGHLFVVVAWLVGMNFECYDMQSTMLGVLMLVTTAALRDRPPARPGGSAA
ncbi:MAG: O-antigen ligase family protein, partial [Phycisphaerales bacterium]|nr:O-antigen ligase family protein [Phycisphaerales bacterium]